MGSLVMMGFHLIAMVLFPIGVLCLSEEMRYEKAIISSRWVAVLAAM